MANKAKCKYCTESLDRDKEKYVRFQAGKTFRHAHYECYINSGDANGEIIDPSLNKPCFFCKELIDLSKDDWLKIHRTHYCHKECKEKDSKREKTSEEKLDEYIMELFGLDYVTPMIQKQKKKIMEEYPDFTYNGMEYSLKYFYEVKKNNLSKSNNGIGIIPYIYREAKNYYYNIWLVNKANKEQKIETYVPETTEIHIADPVYIDYKKNKFSFLDEE